MSDIAFTRHDHGGFAFYGSYDPQVLLIDSVFETIAAKRIALHANPLMRMFQRFKAQAELQRTNPDCAVYWCAVDSTVGYACVSNLSLSDSTSADINDYVRQSSKLKQLSSQLMSIGYALPSYYSEVLMVLNSPVGTRHVYFIGGKPAFSRVLPPSSSADSCVESLRATQQHLLHRGMLDGDPLVLCHGLCASTQSAIASHWSESVEPLRQVMNEECLKRNDQSIERVGPLSSLAEQAYDSAAWKRWLFGSMPGYWIQGLERFRYRQASLRMAVVVSTIAAVFVTASIANNVGDWSQMMLTKAAIKNTLEETQSLQVNAQSYSAQPMLTAQQLQRLDVLRSLQPAKTDDLLFAVSSVFEKHPRVSLNHLSWFSVLADEVVEHQQVAHRLYVPMESDQSDHLSVLVTGRIEGESLSEQQALFGELKNTLLAIEGVSGLVEEQTPITQWRMPTAALKTIDQQRDSFAVRFSLSRVSS